MSLQDDQAELHSLEPLARLLDALRPLSPLIRQTLMEEEAQYSRRLERIEARLDDAEDDVRAAEQHLDAIRGDEDADTYGAELAVEAARDRRDRIRAASERARSAFSRYEHAANHLDRTGPGLCAGGLQFLEERLAAARAYLSIEAPSHVRQAAASSRSTTGPAAAADQDDPPLPPLPIGFFWLPLHRVAPMDALSEDDGWRHLPRSHMLMGLKAFQADILPLLGAPGFSREVLAQKDKELGRIRPGGLVTPDNLANLYEVFFGADPVAAGVQDDGLFHLSNGKHRVHLARSLGWTHIPARLVGQRGPP